MQVVFESAIARDATERLEAIVARSVADRRLPEAGPCLHLASAQRVVGLRLRRGRASAPPGGAIRAALLREAPEESARHAPLRRLREV